MFQKANRSRVFLKLAITAPSGGGKTWSAIKIARGLVGPEGRIAAIDTENGSMSLYSHLDEFDVADLSDFSPEAYIRCIEAAEDAGYDCLIIDSFSHAWKFIIDFKTSLDARGGNGMMNWRVPKERMEKLKQKVLQSKMHIICNLRSKTEFIQNDKGGYIKAGLQAVGEPDVEYEFTVVFSVDMNHKAMAGLEGQGKDRTGIFAEMGLFTPSEKTGEMLANWLKSAPDQTVKVTAAPAESSAEQGGKKTPSATGLYLRDVMKFSTDDLAEYRTLCSGNGFDSSAVTPVLMALEDKTFDDARDTVAIMVGLRDLSIEPTVDTVVAVIDAVDLDTDQLLQVLDSAKTAGIPDLDSLLEFLKGDDQGDQGGGSAAPAGTGPTTPAKPANSRKKKEEEGVAA